MKRITKDFTIRPKLNRRERDMLLASLCLWQLTRAKDRPLRAKAIASDFATPLNRQEIEELRERLNFSKTKSP